MISFATVLLFFAPTCVYQMPTVLERSWTVKSGLIFDAKGNEVGIYGVDVMPNSLLR